MRLNVIIVLGLFAASLAAGLLAPAAVSAGTLEQLRDAFGPLQQLGPGGLFLVVFFNNAIKSLAAITLGVLLGLPSLFFLVINGWTIGLAAAAVAAKHGWLTVFAGLAPHGIIELPAILAATALGLAVGRESYNHLIGQHSSVRSRLKYSLKVYASGILPSLFVAAGIEVFITPILVALVRG